MTTPQAEDLIRQKSKIFATFPRGEGMGGWGIFPGGEGMGGWGTFPRGEGKGGWGIFSGGEDLGGARPSPTKKTVSLCHSEEGECLVWESPGADCRFVAAHQALYREIATGRWPSQ